MEKYVNKDGKTTLVTLTPSEEAIELAKIPTPDQVFNEKVVAYSSGVQTHLDALAVSWGYDSIISLCSYAGDSNPRYTAEGTAGKIWRSVAWEYCEVELAKIGRGERPEPESVEAFILELPTIERP